MYIIILICFSIFTIHCNEIKNQIYYEFPDVSISHCIRRLNVSSSIGCSSKSDGNVGAIEIIFNENELQSKLRNLKEDTILIINSELFIKANITDEILLHSFVNGLIVFEQENCNDTLCNDTSIPFSEDYKIPNQLYSYSFNKSYNPSGTAYGFKNWPFPVSLISKRYKNEQDKIIECYKKFNLNPKSKRKCALEIRNFMAAVNSSETCLYFESIQNKFINYFHPVNFCWSFSGKSYVVHTNNNYNNNNNNVTKKRDPNSVILLLSRIDSLSMFEKSAFNVHGTVTSAALLLSVMSLLMSQPEFQNPPTKLKKDVLFVFLDNESYDYLGSNRFINDLKENKIKLNDGVPINDTHLDLLLEFGEMGYSNFTETSFFYPPFYNKNGDVDVKTPNFVAKLWNSFKSFGFLNSYTSQDLPPSSAQYFLRQLNNHSLSTIVMSDYKDKFKNTHYNSYLDNKKMKNNSQELVAIVNAVASFIFEEATEKNLTETMTESSDYNPYNIIDCFTNNIRCDLLKEFFQFETIEKLHSLGTPIPLQEHFSSTNDLVNYRFSYLLENLILAFSGKRINNSECKACPKCTNITMIETGNNTSKCYTKQFTVATEFTYLNPKDMPSWFTSAVVDKQSIKMFVQAPNIPLLVVGIIMTLSVTIFMTAISSKISEIFQVDS